MLSGLRFRSVGRLVAAGTTVASLAMLAVAVPSGAAASSKEYSATFESMCKIAPGVLNIETPFRGHISWIAPEIAIYGNPMELSQASVSLTGAEGIGESFVALGVHELRGHITTVEGTTENLEPSKFNLAKPAEYPAGLPFSAAVQKALSIYAPSLKLGETGRTFFYGPFTVTGSVGREAVIKVGGPQIAGVWEEPEAGYRFVNAAIMFELEGFNEHGEKVIGPLQTGCEVLAPGGFVTVAEIPIADGIIKAAYNNWKLTGSLTDQKLGQAITLPEGSTFNGSAEILSITGGGSVKGNVSIPPFSSTFKLFGAIPVILGLTLTEAGPLEGTVARSGGGDTLSIPAKLNMGITSVKLFGLTVPTKCATAEPLALALSDNLTSEELLKQGWSFAGGTTVPKVKCEGGLLGGLFGATLSALLSGPENPYAIKVTAPS